MSGTVHMRTRLVVGSVAITIGAIAAAGVAVDRTVSVSLRRSHTADLVAMLELGALHATAESLRPRRPGEADGNGPRPILAASEAGLDGRRVLWLVRDPKGGDPRGRSRGFPGLELPSSEEVVVFEDVDAESGEPYRIAGFTLEPAATVRRAPGRRPPLGPLARLRPGERFEVFAAVPIESERELITFLRKLLIVVGTGAALAAGLFQWLNVRFGLRPVGALAERISAFAPGALDAPLALERDTVELRPIVAALEESRSGLARAFQRQSRFTADAAHELRTPLAGLRAALEVALRRERPVEQHVRTAHECLTVVRGMEGALEALLMLARAEAPDGEALEPVDLDAVLRRARALHADALAARDAGLEIETAPELALAWAHRALVERIVNNLVANVAAHANAGSTATAALACEAANVSLRVVNEGGSLPAEAAERAAEPFWRGDAARSVDGEHAGLGLAIARTAAEALGGRLDVEVEPAAGGTRFAVQLTLPRASLEGDAHELGARDAAE